MCIYALAAAVLRPMVVPVVAKLGQHRTIVLALMMLIASMLLLPRLITNKAGKSKT